ncbi:hypothetical protein RRG08_006388 [Elysia crispata]|uniref:Uncharacterized protein n=1 Tax=Elysia crispata TaxID=231223 RepID=A0AAE0Y292_9GAST|nr:hypothetical protein RRG08_006388 [Elysia crispata]
MYFCSAAHGATASGPSISVLLPEGLLPLVLVHVFLFRCLWGLLRLVHVFQSHYSWGYCFWSWIMYFYSADHLATAPGPSISVPLLVGLLLLVLVHVFLFCCSWGYCSWSIYFCSAARGATASGPGPFVLFRCSWGYCFWSIYFCSAARGTSAPGPGPSISLPLRMQLLLLVHLFMFCYSSGYFSWSCSIYFCFASRGVTAPAPSISFLLLQVL